MRVPSTLAAIAWSALAGPAHADPAAEALHDAIAGGKVETVSSLIDAGGDVGSQNAARVSQGLIDGLATACEMQPVPVVRVSEMLALLVRHGFPIGYADALGNTVLLSAAQLCPAPVVRAVLDDGAPPDAMNRQHFTPLMMAFVSGKWEVASVLVDHGARITAKQSSQIFFEPPTDPAARALLARATR